MMKQKKKVVENKKVFRYKNMVAGAVAAVIIALALFLCFFMIHNINQQMNASATSNLLNTTQVIEGNMENFIQKDFESLNVIGEMYKDGTYFDGENIDGLRDTMGFEWIGAVDVQKNGVDCTGNKFNISDMPWYSEWESEEKGYSDAYYGTSGRLETALWMPIYEGEDYVGTIFGNVILTKYYSANVFTFYEGAGRTYLFDSSDGKWIMKSLGADGLISRQDNIYSLLLNSGNSSDDVSAFQQAVKDGNTGTITLNFNGEQSYICFMPLTTSPDWYVSTVIARDVLLKESNKVQSMISMLLGVFCIAILIFAILFMKWIIHRTKIKEANYREALFANVSANIDSAFLIYDKNYKKTVFVSDNIERLLGIERSWLEEAGHMFDWCKIEEADFRRRAFLEGTLKQAAVCEACIENETSTKSRYVRLELFPADYDQEIAVLTDITKDKDIQSSLIDAMERAEEASRAKNDFLSAMSHDIRTPMNGVVGMTAIAAAHLDDKERVKDCLAKINDASAHLLSLINEILDMSRIESGKMKFVSEPFNIGEILQETLDMNYQGIKQKNHTIKARISSLAHERVIGDSVQLQRIVDNLLSNAIKYTPEGGIISLILQEKTSVIEGYGCYEIIVKDNGIGMSREFQKKLFQPFEREEDVRLTKIQGTGLGMSIVKNIVSLMMGDIQVESEKNRGTTLRATVNLRLDNQETAAEAKLSGLPVLVVDDDMDICRSVTDMFCDIGMIGEWADSGPAAIEKVWKRHQKKEDYMAVLLDWKMPDMDGVETARRIRRKIDSGIPIFILTAYDWSEIEKEAREAGIDAFLSKPLYKAKLQQKMKTMIEGRGEAKEIALVNGINESTAGKRVLLAEDNELNMEIAVEILKMMQIDTEWVENGAAAVERFAGSSPGTYDLILMDIQMPKMNGYEAAKTIRSMERLDSCRIPIIAMTADAFAQDVKEAHLAGMDAHISKPIAVENFMHVLSSYLSGEKAKEQREGDTKEDEKY